MRTRRAEEWILLSWVVPFFLISGWFQVKFPRYLLPIYPVMILWAAAWLWRITLLERLPRMLTSCAQISTLYSRL